MAFQEPKVRRAGHRIYVRDYPGEGNPILLMHGFPDNLHLYDRVVPHLTPTRRVVTFDFLGWGASDKPASYRPTARNQLREVETVIDQLGLEDPVVVAHDASGPPGIDWALLHPDRLGALVLLNTYYQWTPSLRRPGAIALYSTPVVRGLARAIIRRSDDLDRRLYYWQVGRFIRDPEVRAEVVPRLYSDFRVARPAFWALNDDLLATVISRRKLIPEMRAFARPVRIIFGAADPYLNKRVARKFHEPLPSIERPRPIRKRSSVTEREPTALGRGDFMGRAVIDIWLSLDGFIIGPGSRGRSASRRVAPVEPDRRGRVARRRPPRTDLADLGWDAP